jgi:hypothetical protein
MPQWLCIAFWTRVCRAQECLALRFVGATVSRAGLNGVYARHGEYNEWPLFRHVGNADLWLYCGHEPHAPPRWLLGGSDFRSKPGHGWAWSEPYLVLPQDGTKWTFFHDVDGKRRKEEQHVHIEVLNERVLK